MALFVCIQLTCQKELHPFNVISATHSVKRGTCAVRQLCGVTDLAAVSQCLRIPFLINLIEPGKIESKVICGVLETITPVTVV